MTPPGSRGTFHVQSKTGELRRVSLSLHERPAWIQATADSVCCRRCGRTLLGSARDERYDFELLHSLCQEAA